MIALGDGEAKAVYPDCLVRNFLAPLSVKSESAARQMFEGL